MLNAVPVGLGGGGSMYHPRVSPFDPKLMFVACDMSGLYRTADGGQSWLLCDTRVVQGSTRFSVAFDPADDRRVFGFHPVGGLMESMDHGLNWKPLSGAGFSTSGNVQVTAAAVSSAGDLYVGTTNGLVRRIGGSWGAATLAGVTEVVNNGAGVQIDAANTGDVIKILFVKHPAGGEVCFVATLRDIWRNDLPSTTFVKATGSLPLATDPGPYVSYFYDDTAYPPRLYIASPVRGLAGAYMPGQYYVLYVAIAGRRESAPNSAVATGFTGGVYYCYVDASVPAGGPLPAWVARMGAARQLNQLVFNPAVSPASDFTGTPIARYEHLAIAEQQAASSAPIPDTVYLSAINETFTPNVYKTTDRGLNWDGVYGGFQKGTTNVVGGWLDVEPFTAGPLVAGQYAGLGWGFGGAAHNLGSAPSDSTVAALTNEGVTHATQDGGATWQFRYSHQVAQPGAASQRWRTNGLDVTTNWHYVVHPTKPSIHFICATDIGLCRSDDGAGENWVSASQAQQYNMPANVDRWGNCYELAFGPNSVIWAAVSTQHDIPYSSELNRVERGGVIQSDTDGQTWYRIGNPGAINGLPDKPVVSLVYTEALTQPTIYAAVWGDGIYQATVTTPAGAPVQVGTWTKLGVLPDTRPYRLQFHQRGATKTLYCLIAGVANAAGLYACDVGTGSTTWTDLCSTLRNPNGPYPDPTKPYKSGTDFYAVDFQLRDVPTGVDLYLCTAGVQGQAVGKAWRYDSKNALWVDLALGTKLPAAYHDGIMAFGVFFIEDVALLTTVTHGVWVARASELDQSTATSAPSWVEYPALNFLPTQRIDEAPDKSLYISTFGGGVWHVLRQCFFIMDRGSVAKTDVTASGPPASFPKAFYVVYDGFVPTELGVTPSMTQAQRAALGPKITVTDASGTVLSDPTATCTDLIFEDPALPAGTQRFTFEYQVHFAATGAFVPGATTLTLAVAPASWAPIACSAQLELTDRQPQPQPSLVNGTNWVLSDALQVFHVAVGGSIDPAVPALTFNPASERPETAALRYLNGMPGVDGLTAKLNNTPGLFGNIINAINATPTLRTLYLSQKVSGQLMFNFAIAKLTYPSGAMLPANNVQVFFRLFTVAVTWTTYEILHAYRRAPWGTGAIALLGTVTGLQGPEIATIPCFASPRVDPTTQPTTAQTDPPNRQSIAVGQTERYFACWLDFNQADGRFPLHPLDDGPYGVGAVQSVQQLIRGNHQCLVAEIFFPDGPPIADGQTPGTTNQLAQRNLAIDESSNPGTPASRTVQHTFDIRALRRMTQEREVVWETAGRLGDITNVAGEAGADGPLDELMIRWGDLPRSARATLYAPALDADKIIELAARRHGPARLERVDAHMLECLVGDVTFLPLPPDRVNNVAALLTLELPAGVRAGQLFRVLVQQVVHGNPGRPWRVAGAFEFEVPVRKAPALLLGEERKLALMRYIEQGVPPHDRWAPVVGRYVSRIADRVRGFGGDPARVPPSPVGAPGDGRRAGCALRTFFWIALLIVALALARCAL